MPEKYVCIKTFGVPHIDKNGEVSGKDYHMVSRGMLFDRTLDDSYRFVGSPSIIRLRNSLFTIEITKKQFMENFEKAEDIP